MLQLIIVADKNKEMESAVVKLPDISAEKGLLRDILKGGTAREVIEEASEADIRKEKILERDKINGGICTKFSELH
jgi:predicted ATPase